MTCQGLCLKMKSLMATPFNSALCLILYVITSSYVEAQTAFPITLTAAPTTNVSPGTILNLTCSFKLLKDSFTEIRVRKGDNLIAHVTNQPIDKTDYPLVIDSGLRLSNDLDAADSLFWMTKKSTLCDVNDRKVLYKCEAHNTRLDYAEGSTEVTFAGPTRLLTLNGAEICQDDTHTLSHEQINKTQNFKFAVSNEGSEINDGELEINGDVGSLTPSRNELCTFGGEVSKPYTFTKSGDYDVAYRYTLGSATDPIKKTCRITVQDIPTTTTTTTTTTVATTVTTTIATTTTTEPPKVEPTKTVPVTMPVTTKAPTQPPNPQTREPQVVDKDPKNDDGTEPPTSPPSSNTPTIVGSVVGVLAFIGIAVGGYFCYKKKTKGGYSSGSPVGV